MALMVNGPRCMFDIVDTFRAWSGPSDLGSMIQIINRKIPETS